MLRRLIRGLTVCGCAMAAGCGASASGTGLTPDFADAARKAHSYQKSDLIPGIGTARFPVAYAASRARVKIVQSKVASEADQGVWLLLTMVNVKSSELNGAREMAETMTLSPQTMRTMREAQEDVATERDTCLSEADGWLSGKSMLLASLKERPCLKQAKLALAVLSKKN
jgi:hypothetical protein